MNTAIALTPMREKRGYARVAGGLLSFIILWNYTSHEPVLGLDDYIHSALMMVCSSITVMTAAIALQISLPRLRSSVWNKRAIALWYLLTLIAHGAVIWVFS